MYISKRDIKRALEYNKACWYIEDDICLEKDILV